MFCLVTLVQIASSHSSTGFGIVFALLMNGITWVGRKYLNESSVNIIRSHQMELLADLSQDTQMLMTAKKSVKTGLVASAVVSSCINYSLFSTTTSDSNYIQGATLQLY
jgi:hypothetical protein